MVLVRSKPAGTRKPVSLAYACLFPFSILHLQHSNEICLLKWKGKVHIITKTHHTQDPTAATITLSSSSQSQSVSYFFKPTPYRRSRISASLFNPTSRSRDDQTRITPKTPRLPRFQSQDTSRASSQCRSEQSSHIWSVTQSKSFTPNAAVPFETST